MKKVFSEILRYFVLTVGAGLFAVSIALFLNPLSLAPGGVAGIAFIKYGKKFFFSTIYVIFVSSAIVEVISRFTANQPVITDNPLLAGIAGGTCLALGVGTVFHAGGTTGGSDIVIKLLRRKYRYLNTGTIFFCFDLCVISVSAIVLKDIEIALYALITVFVSSRVIDFVLYGISQTKLVYIISDKSSAIASKITGDLDLGVTFIDGEGGYSGKEKRILLCAVRNQVFPKLKKAVKDEDDRAFIIVSNASSVYGEGHQAIDKEEL